MPRCGTGERYGQSVSSSSSSAGTLAAAAASVRSRGIGHVAGERHVPAALDDLVQVLGQREAVQHDGAARLAQHRQRVVGRLARMDHERLAVALRELDLAREGRGLRGAGGAVAVVVEPALPHGHCRRVAQQRIEPGAHVVVPELGAVRMQPDRGEDAGVSARQADRLLGELRRVADADDALDAGRGGLLDRGTGAAVQALQVRVGVDHAAGASTRGKSGPPEASTGRPLPVPSTLALEGHVVSCLADRREHQGRPRGQDTATATPRARARPRTASPASRRASRRPAAPRSWPAPRARAPRRSG